MLQTLKASLSLRIIRKIVRPRRSDRSRHERKMCIASAKLLFSLRHKECSHDEHFGHMHTVPVSSERRLGAATRRCRKNTPVNVQRGAVALPMRLRHHTPGKARFFPTLSAVRSH